MSIRFEKAGILTTVQDLGRHFYRRFGINPGGVMDKTAARLINILLANEENEAVLEMHFPAPKIVFESNAIAAIGGADFVPTLDGQPIENWRPFFAKKNSVLQFTQKISGNRGYLAIKGGLKINDWLGSQSTNLAAMIGGLDGRKIVEGDRIELNEKIKRPKAQRYLRISNSLIPHYSPFPTVRVLLGGEFNFLSDQGHELLLSQNFNISNNSNRMGFRLSGEPLTISEPQELVSSAVSFGTIQLLPDGQLIVLMADHQTAGGYPRIAQVITHDLPLLAQLGAKDKVAFHLVSVSKAESLTIAFEKELNFLRVGCKFHTKDW
ncbi:MAG: biotin-dependent carboxyltransferase family protein [Pyrinomonadaceae bacterium]